MDPTLLPRPAAAPSPAAKPALGAADRTLRWIAAFKYFKALLVASIGLGAMQLVRPEAVRTARHWVASLGGGWADRELAQLALARLTGFSDHELRAIGAGAFLLAALFAVEGTGLWLRKRWGEALTVFATSSLLPFEVYHLLQRPTAARAAALLVNLALVAFLVWVLWRQRAARAGSRRRTDADTKLGSTRIARSRGAA